MKGPNRWFRDVKIQVKFWRSIILKPQMPMRFLKATSKRRKKKKSANVKMRAAHNMRCLQIDCPEMESCMMIESARRAISGDNTNMIYSHRHEVAMSS